MASTFHDRFVKEDYERMLQVGMRTAREGLRWHLIEREPHVYDFSTALPMIEAAQKMGIQIIWDLLHFGWPDFLDVFADDCESTLRISRPDLRVFYAGKLRILPSSRPSMKSHFFRRGSLARTLHIFPFARKRGGEMKRQLVRASIAASDAVLSELPDARLVAPEPVIHIVGDSAHPDDVREAEAYRTSMFEAWDMLSGRLHPELGGQEKYLDVIGINYYDANQWWNHGKTIFRGEPQYRPFREIVQEVYKRYGRSMFVSETGTEDAKRPAWFAYICEEVQAARRTGVEFTGFVCTRS